ncbi:MAG: hypothetical protein ISS70_22295 [Phycisphaerae bacterium]|nr:hypothetical protein [Phycisphaerae bacterium]
MQIGFDPLGSSRHNITKYHMRLRYVLYNVLASGSAGPKSKQDSLEVVSATPQTPAALSLGEKLFVKVRYRLGTIPISRAAREQKN